MMSPKIHESITQIYIDMELQWFLCRKMSLLLEGEGKMMEPKELEATENYSCQLVNHLRIADCKRPDLMTRWY